MEVKGQGHQADLLIAPLTHQAAAVVSVGTYYYVASAGAAVGSAARGASAATDGREGRGISWRPLAYSLLVPVIFRVLFTSSKID